MMLPKHWGAGTTLILLAHQDDEIALAPLLRRLVSAGKTLRLVYLTDGGMFTAPARRNAESLRALAFLGLETANVHFLGSEIGVRDGRLIFHLSTVFDHLDRMQSGSGTVEEIYALAWEGGHQDHDAAYVLAAAVAAAGNSLRQAWQVPFYRAADSWPTRFSLFAPLPDSGPVTEVNLAASEMRLRTSLLRFYPSQWRTWIGLGPAIVWRSLRRAPFKMQRILPERAWMRPMPGPLLYEQRTDLNFVEFSRHASAFLNSRGLQCP